jgi:hypothetical protein
MVDFRQAEMLVQFDAIFENMKFFYFMLKDDKDCPDDLTIDFGKIINLNFLSELYVEVNGCLPDSDRLGMAQAYIEMQGKSIDDCNSLDMEEIANKINPQNLYEVAILLFIYEKNHNSLDQNRLWTIDHLPVNINHAVEFLIENSKNYRIF